jgi:hypothetical protein
MRKVDTLPIFLLGWTGHGQMRAHRNYHCGGAASMLSACLPACLPATPTYQQTKERGVTTRIPGGSILILRNDVMHDVRLILFGSKRFDSKKVPTTTFGPVFTHVCRMGKKHHGKQNKICGSLLQLV